MNLADNLAALRAHWVSIVAVAMATVLAAAGISAVLPRTYTASASVFLTVPSGTAGERGTEGSGYLDSEVKSFAQVVTKPVVLDPVIAQLSLPTDASRLAEQVGVNVPAGTAIIEISVDGADPELTTRITEAIGSQLIAAVDELAPRGTDGSTTVKATIIAAPVVPTVPTSPRVAVNLALGGLLGVVLGLVQAVVRRRLDATIIEQSDLAEVTDRSVIGVIGFDADAAEHPLVFTGDAPSPRAEAYRRLRTTLQFLSIQSRNRAIVVTSAVAGEGKTTSAINLAFALADAGERVLLIDADLRRPRVADYLNVEGAAGLTTVLSGRARLADLVQPASQYLDVLPAGPVPPNPPDLLESEDLDALLSMALSRYGYVVIDCPAVLGTPDATLLAQRAGGTVLVVGSRGVRKPELASALAALESVHPHLLGLVVNKQRSEPDGSRPRRARSLEPAGAE